MAVQWRSVLELKSVPLRGLAMKGRRELEVHLFE
jgi:hypothetical protein